MALRSVDGEAPRRNIGTLYAGDDPAGLRVDAGACVRIMTGAALPEGADAVVPVERLRAEGGLIHLEVLPKPGDHVRRQASQARSGDLLLPPGTPLNAARIGLLAQVGDPMPALERIVVAVASTGDELTAEPRPHQIRDSNGPMLTALAHRLGAEARRLPSLPDDPAALAARLRDLDGIRVLLTSGGVSMGQKDHLPAVLQDLGARILFHKLRLKPGKPMLVALLPHPGGDRVILGLPGNPLSAYLNARLFLPVVLARLEGTAEPDPWRHGELGEGVRNPGDRPLLQPCLRDGQRLLPLASQGSGDLAKLAQADACAWIPEGGADAGPCRYLDLP
ncbi:MAG: molybdopterin molybdotransferase MoeA [Holophagaceae bacterium]|nr:molybdopterin molybdotransferase MoeA [Holophagaceae bacterium]